MNLESLNSKQLSNVNLNYCRLYFFNDFIILLELEQQNMEILFAGNRDNIIESSIYLHNNKWLTTQFQGHE